METVISVGKPHYQVQIPSDAANLDKLNFLAGKRVDEVNKMAELGTQIAHVDGGVPNMKVCMPALTAQYIGQLFYFFELACGISGSMLGVNPFDQPGVEAYKNNMFAHYPMDIYRKLFNNPSITNINTFRNTFSITWHTTIIMRSRKHRTIISESHLCQTIKRPSIILGNRKTRSTNSLPLPSHLLSGISPSMYLL
jgi:hypothetical protein